MTLTKRNRVLFGALGAIFVIGLPGRLAWSMRSSALDDAATVRSDTEAQRVELEKAQKSKANESKLRAEYERLARAMPATPDQQSLLDTLAGLAADTNVSWELLTSAVPQPSRTSSARDTGSDEESGTKPTTPKTTADGSEQAPVTASASNASFAFDATVAGDEASVTAFLERMRGIDRLVVIDKVQLTWNGGSSGAGGGITARLSMRAFTWKVATKAGSTTTSTAP